MGENVERNVESGRPEDKKGGGGYVPDTTLGPPPQGEPLLTPQDQASAVPATSKGQSQVQEHPIAETPHQQDN